MTYINPYDQPEPKEKQKHKCNNHQLYFEDELSRGTFCSVCNKIIDEEIFHIKE